MQVVKNVAFTVITKNYLHYAKTSADAYLEVNSDSKFYILLVDEIGGDIDVKEFESERCEIVEVKEIGIENFDSIAFKFDVFELLTGVKPTFIKYLQREKGAEKVMYIDGDMYVYENLDDFFNLLDTYSVILTPHILNPIEDDMKPKEQDLLRSGVYNLGYIGVGNGAESKRFLDWWEKSCLNNGFDEIRNGLFGDQKFLDLVPCLYDEYLILKDEGCNVAYWNLNERKVSEKDGKYYINDNTPLKFFHFSGINVFDEMQISNYQNRYHLSDDPILFNLFYEYREKLLSNGYEKVKDYKYKFGMYSNGEKITSMARKLYAANLDEFEGINPFDVNAPYYKWAKKRNLLDSSEELKSESSMTIDKEDRRLKMIHSFLKMLLRVFGANKYSALMKYLSYISVERNQKDIFK